MSRWQRKMWLLCTGVIALTGCNVLKNSTGIPIAESKSYLEAKTLPKLAIPPDLNQDAVEDQWEIPEIAELPSAKVYPKTAPKPASVVGEADPDLIRIQKLGERRWMVVQRKPDTVWPMLRQFLTFNLIGTGSEDPDSGIIVTAPLTLSERDESDWMYVTIRERYPGLDDADRLAFRVEQGIRRGTSEVHLRYLTPNNEIAAVDWHQESVHGDLEGALLTQVAEFDAAKVEPTAISIVGAGVATLPKALIVRDAEGYPSLELNIDFERAWATVAQALKKAEISNTIVREDDREFEFKVPRRFIDQKSEGFFRRLIPGGEQNASIEVVLRIDESPESQAVRVFSVDGEPLAVEIAEQILVAVQQYAA